MTINKNNKAIPEEEMEWLSNCCMAPPLYEIDS